MQRHLVRTQNIYRAIYMKIKERTQNFWPKPKGFVSNLWRRLMDSEKAIYRLILLLVVAGFVYFTYSLYYGSGILLPNPWNSRPSKNIDHLYVKDPVLKAVHDRMLNDGKGFSKEITIVTAYFNLGNLNKGGVFGSYTPDRYKKWMSVFGRIDNPIIVFTDSPDVVELFKGLRRHFSPQRTTIVPVNRTDLWAFSLAPKIREIYNQPGYPDYDPNTVNENYSCVMHAKFELVNKVIKEGMFTTKYIAWLDIGLYRAIVSESHIFPIRLPPGFDPKKVAYSGQHTFDPTLSPYQIIVEDKTWVGGAMFLGKPEQVYIYTHDYMRAVGKLITENMMSTDQQVIYIMYQPSFHFDANIEIQTYTSHSTDDWFYLGYSIKETWDASLRRAVSLVKFLHLIL